MVSKKQTNMIIIVVIALIAIFFIAKQADLFAAVEINGCVDTDGDNIFTLGTTTDRFDVARTDYCLSDTRVREYVCSATGGYSTRNVDCPSGEVCSNGYCSGGPVAECVVHADCASGEECQDGQCVDGINPLCSETDGGKNELLAGLLTLGDVTVQDTCDNNRVIEYYCVTDTSYTSETIQCSTGFSCSGGACVDDNQPVCTDGQSQCLSGTTYQECLSGGWGGIKHCPTETTCSGGICVAATSCTPGSVISCTDNQGQTGAKTCNAQGTSYGVCVIGAEPPTGTCDATAFPQKQVLQYFTAVEDCETARMVGFAVIIGLFAFAIIALK